MKKAWMILGICVSTTALAEQREIVPVAACKFGVIEALASICAGDAGAECGPKLELKKSGAVIHSGTWDPAIFQKPLYYYIFGNEALRDGMSVDISIQSTGERWNPSHLLWEGQMVSGFCELRLPDYWARVMDRMGGPVPPNPPHPPLPPNPPDLPDCSKVSIDIETVAPKEARHGDDIFYQVYVTNRSECGIAHLAINDAVPYGVVHELSDPKPVYGPGTTVGARVDGGFVRWREIKLSPRSTLSLEMVGRAIADPGQAPLNKVCVYHPKLKAAVCDTVETAIISSRRN